MQVEEQQHHEILFSGTIKLELGKHALQRKFKVMNFKQTICFKQMLFLYSGCESSRKIFKYLTLLKGAVGINKRKYVYKYV